MNNKITVVLPAKLEDMPVNVQVALNTLRMSLLRFSADYEVTITTEAEKSMAKVVETAVSHHNEEFPATGQIGLIPQ